MVEVTLDGWRPGLNKIALTKALQSEAGLPLGEAHARTEEIVAGRTVRLSLADTDRAARLVSAAQNLGVGVTASSIPPVRNAG